MSRSGTIPTIPYRNSAHSAITCHPGVTNRGLWRKLTVSQMPVTIAILSESGKSNKIYAAAFLSHLFICNFLTICHLNVSKNNLLYWQGRYYSCGNGSCQNSLESDKSNQSCPKSRFERVQVLNTPFQLVKQFKYGIRQFLCHILFGGSLLWAAVLVMKWISEMTLLFLVSRKVASLFECLTTLVTAKPLFITVDKQVPFKGDFISEHFLT